ncbi:MAG TPA: hypothetical protein PK760_01600, partial [Flavobacteriales bacterium]|nr:hypothetical protein [Flavobacteriales bacterium]
TGRGKFFKYTNYRMGVRHANDYLGINGTNLTQTGLSVGACFPLVGGNAQSRINIGAEFGQRGTTAKGLLRERYADVYIGITITPGRANEPTWFVKRRID